MQSIKLLFLHEFFEWFSNSISRRQALCVLQQQELHNMNNNLFFVVDKMKKIKKVDRPVPNLNNKKKYVVHI